MIDGQNVLNQPIKIHLKTYDNIRKFATGQGDDYTSGCLLDYLYVKENYKLIAIDLSKQQALDADPKAIQKINFTGNLAQNSIVNTTIFFIRNRFRIFTRNCESIVNLFYFNIISV